MADKALAQIKVLEYGHGVAGPYCAKMLADLGADVIKVEDAGTGDPARRDAPFPSDEIGLEQSGLFAYLNTNKKGITLNLDSEDGRQIFKRLCGLVDVLIEDRAPAQMAGWGLDFARLHALHPQLIVTSITGFGQSGPYRDYVASEMILQQVGGLAYVSPPDVRDPDQPPLKLGTRQAEFQGALNGAYGTLAALWGRDALGRGQQVDVSIQECMASILEATIQNYTYIGLIRSRRNPLFAHPLKLVRAKDGYVYICCVTEAEWQRLVEWMGNPDWAELEFFATRVTRAENIEALEPLLEEFTLQQEPAALYHEAQSRRIPFAQVNTMQDVVESKHLNARGFFVEADHPVLGRLKYPGAAYLLSETPWALETTAPLLGQHNNEVYGGRLGYSLDDIVRLREQGTI